MSLITSQSPHSVRGTAERAVAALARRGIELFARIDHAAGARQAGLALGDEELLIFGDPRVGTLLMQSDPAVGYELPLRLLVWDCGGQTQIGFRAPRELAGAYDLAAQERVLQGMSALLEGLVAESVASD